MISLLKLLSPYIYTLHIYNYFLCTTFYTGRWTHNQEEITLWQIFTPEQQKRNHWKPNQKRNHWKPNQRHQFPKDVSFLIMTNYSQNGCRKRPEHQVHHPQHQMTKSCSILLSDKKQNNHWRRGIPSVWGGLCIEHEKALNERN